MSYTVETARSEDLVPAFRLMYRDEFVAQQSELVRESLKLVLSGDLHLHNILVIRQAAEVIGMLVWWANRGAAGQLWPPRVKTGHDRELAEDLLLSSARERMRQDNVKVLQSLVTKEEVPLIPALVRNGFAHVTNLFLMARDLPGSICEEPGADWRFFPFVESDREHFQQIMKRTYHGSLDFPELDDRREMEEILEGHKYQGHFDPRYWVLAHWQNQPVGVILLTEIPGAGEWELSYLGLVPEFRGRGLGQALIDMALILAAEAGAKQLVLAVDQRNQPAFKLYANAGFQFQGEKQVFLKFLT
jgi:mycothiol synthase